MQGWIKLYREILDTELWHDVTTFRLFTYLLLNATHKDGTKIGGIELKRGQWIRSYRKLAQDLAYKEGRGTKTYSLKTIKKCIDKLISDERVNVQETEQGTLFTILNYDKYQGFLEDENKTGNTLDAELETNGKRKGNNNKNVKNEKKYKEEDNNPILLYEQNFVTITPFQMEKLWDWVDDFNGNKDVVCMAIRETAIKNPTTPFNYLERILQDWYRRKLFTVEDVIREKERYEKSKVVHFTKGGVKQRAPVAENSKYDYGF